jgi:hypothetical protein
MYEKTRLNVGLQNAHSFVGYVKLTTGYNHFVRWNPQQMFLHDVDKDIDFQQHNVHHPGKYHSDTYNRQYSAYRKCTSCLCEHKFLGMTFHIHYTPLLLDRLHLLKKWKHTVQLLRCNQFGNKAHFIGLMFMIEMCSRVS